MHNYNGLHGRHGPITQGQRPSCLPTCIPHLVTMTILIYGSSWKRARYMFPADSPSGCCRYLPEDHLHQFLSVQCAPRMRKVRSKLGLSLPSSHLSQYSGHVGGMRTACGGMWVGGITRPIRRAIGLGLSGSFPHG